mgnify:FL=1
MDFRQNYYDMFTMVIKVRYLLLVIGSGITCGAGIFFLYGGFDYDNIYENANVWYKVSTDHLNPGEVVALDMSRGYSMCNDGFIYLVVHASDTNEEVIVAFPDGGYWSAPGVDTTSMEIQKHFGKLEQDLRKR